MAKELSDAEVFGAPTELTDAQVFGSSPVSIRAHPVDDPPLPSVSEYGDIGPGAWFNASAPSTPQQPAQLPNFTRFDEYGRPVDQPPDMSGIAGAIKEGWRGSPSFWTTPQVRQGAYDLPVVGPLVGNAGDLVGGLFGAGGAAIRGGQEAAREAIEPFSPSLARDVAAAPEAFPFGFGQMGGFKPAAPRSYTEARAGSTRTPLQIRANTPPPVTLNELTGAIDRVPDAPVNQLAPAPQPTPEPQPEQQSEPTQGAPEPQPAAAGGLTPEQTAENSAWVGSTAGQVHDLVQQHAAQGGPASLNAAATPEQLAAMSPQMEKAYRRMAEVNRVVSPIEGEDTSIKVPGSVPTKAEAVGDPAISQQEGLVRQRKPEAYEGPQGRLTQNNAARLKLYDEMTPSGPQIQTIAEDQAKQARDDTALVNRNAGPVDGTPVAARLQQILADPRIMEQPDVVKVLQPIHDALYDAEGNLKTDIQSYWGMHDNLMNKLAKAKDPLQASSSEKFAFNQLTDAKTAIDDAMSKASGGAFQTFLDNQRAFFQKRNAATVLRDFREKAGSVDPKTGYINPNAFHRFVTDLAVRRGQPGIDPAMDIPDGVFGKLMDINDDLKRAGRIDLGKPRGSPTNLFFELANGLGIVGAHSLVHAMGGGPFANVVLQRGIEGIQSRIAGMRLNSLVEQSLNYPPAPPAPNPNPPGPFIPPSLRNPMMPQTP